MEVSFQSALPARGATRRDPLARRGQGVSIRAPRAGSDHRLPDPGSRWRVSIRAPRAGSDLPEDADRATIQAFQSALPARGATPLIHQHSLRFWFQSALPARGATDRERPDGPDGTVSIRAPRAGSDGVSVAMSTRWSCFNPRSPRGERPHSCAAYCREGSFNPRSPRGERPYVQRVQELVRVFQSALPARGAMRSRPRAGRSTRRFNPRSPRGERPEREAARQLGERVSIRAPRAGSDPAMPPMASWIFCFNPRSPRGERPAYREALLRQRVFQSALPARGATHIDKRI